MAVLVAHTASFAAAVSRVVLPSWTLLVGALLVAGCGDVRLGDRPPSGGSEPDAALEDAAFADAAADVDLGAFVDSGAGPLDLGPPDLGPPDLGPPDLGPPDLGPPPEDCHALLDHLGLDWTAAGATRGIADPVRVGPMIGGVRFRYGPSTTASPMLMDCSLGPRLVQLVALLREWDIEEVEHLGVYNYRCIGGGDPDSGTCTPSMHAYARAIDLHAFRQRGTAVLFDTETDWVISTSDRTCPGTPVNDEDRMLHEVACRMWSDRIFQIVLTPDYNAAHRNHFHVDMTVGSMFIGREIVGVDPPIAGLGD